MKVIKLLVVLVLYFISLLITANILDTMVVIDSMRIFGLVMFICTIAFVTGTEIYHKNKDSIMPLSLLTIIFIFNTIIMSTITSELMMVLLASIMYAIIFVRYLFNTKIEFLGCYNLWLFSAFTILLYFILIFKGSLLIVLLALITLLTVARLKDTNDIEHQSVSFIQTILSIVLIAIIMLLI